MQDKVALVTGGGRGIGRAIALALARERARAVVVGRTPEKLAEVVATVRSRGGWATSYSCDVGDRSDLSRMTQKVTAEVGAVAILVNNAGVTASWKSLEMPDADWDHILAVNLTAAWFCTRAFLPEMLRQRWGRVINIASLAGKFGLRYSVAYSASKHGLLGLTRSLAIEYADSGVTFNAICPGFVDTEMTDRTVATIASKTGRTLEEARQVVASFNAHGRIVAPEEVAAAAVRLAADSGAATNGDAIDVPELAPAGDRG